MHRKHRYKTIPLFSYFSSCSFSHPLCNKQAVIEAVLLSAATEHHFERTAVETRSHWIQSGFSPFDEEAMLTSFYEYFLCRLVKVERTYSRMVFLLIANIYNMSHFRLLREVLNDFGIRNLWRNRLLVKFTATQSWNEQNRF